MGLVQAIYKIIGDIDSLRIINGNILTQTGSAVWRGALTRNFLEDCVGVVKINQL